MLQLSSLSIPIISAIVGALFAFLFFADYLRRRRADVVSLTSASKTVESQKASSSKPPPPAAKKHHPHHRSEPPRKHHHLDVNTLKGHSDSVASLCFSSDAHNLATACADGAIRVFKIDDATSKSFKFLKIELPAGAIPTSVEFSEGASSLVVAAQTLFGASLYMYGNVAKPEGEGKGKPSHPEIVWEHDKVHGKKSILTLFGSVASYGTADGSTLVASCSEGTDIKLWQGKSGKDLGTVDTNQLKNTMAIMSPNGRFLAAAAFTADVKIWEIVYAKDGSVKELVKVMQLKGHRSAVAWLCFTPNSEQVITASKDGTIRIWNINVRYHLDEDPKTLKVFPVLCHDGGGSALHYDRISLSPDGKILAATYGSTLQWVSVETGKVLDTADKAHEGDITGIAWAPQKILSGGVLTTILATSGSDKKVKLWLSPELHS